jgi:hypothetical protein
MYEDSRTISMIQAQKRLSGRSSSSHLASRSPRVHHAWQEDQWPSDEATFTMIESSAQQKGIQANVAERLQTLLSKV